MALIGPRKQRIAFAPLEDKTFGDPDFTVSASASSGLPVAFGATGKCAMSGARLHLTSAGSCTITASQAGDENFRPAPPVAQSFNIEAVPCAVPNVVGKPFAVARSTIARGHCRTGKVTYAYSRTRKRGIVIAQSRAPGLDLPPDAKIDLRVSRGRPPRKR